MYKYNKKMMDSAIQWATHSYCKRKQVGAVLAKDGREIASGYNGTITGSKSNNCEDYYYQCPNCKEITKRTIDLFTMDQSLNIDDPYGKNITLYCNKCNTKINSVSHSEPNFQTKLFEPINQTKSKDSVIHAEKNIIAYCAKHGIPTNKCTLYITLSPCQSCAVLLVQAGITKVIYKTKYKDTAGIDIIEKAGISIQQYEETK